MQKQPLTLQNRSRITMQNCRHIKEQKEKTAQNSLHQILSDNLPNLCFHLYNIGGFWNFRKIQNNKDNGKFAELQRN